MGLAQPKNGRGSKGALSHHDNIDESDGRRSRNAPKRSSTPTTNNSNTKRQEKHNPSKPEQRGLRHEQQARLHAHRPPLDLQQLISVKDFEDEARRRTPKMVLDYYMSGSDDMQTLRWNVEEFSRIRVRPRVLRDVSNLNLSTDLFGCSLRMPLIVAPTAMHRMAHPDGEIGSCGAAHEFGTGFCLSSLATTSIRELREAHPDAHLFYQLYILKDRTLTHKMVQEAEACNYKALFVTVDAPKLGNREADHRNQFHLPEGLRLKNLESALNSEQRPESALSYYFKHQIDASLSWKDLEWLRSITKLPIVLKGIQCAEDARKAADIGVEGIVVSNHGARQLDTAVSTIELLPEVVRAVRSHSTHANMKILVDGGIRRGSSIMKCLALGADCVLVGRPVLFGLCVDGKPGVRRVLDILFDELTLAMQLTGACDIPTLQSFAQTDLLTFQQSPPQSIQGKQSEVLLPSKL